MAADAPREEFIPAGGGIERPPAGGILAQGHRERIVIRPDVEGLASGLDGSPTVHTGVSEREIVKVGGIARRVTGEYEVLAVRAQNCQHGGVIAGLRSRQ